MKIRTLETAKRKQLTARYKYQSANYYQRVIVGVSLALCANRKENNYDN